MSKLTKSQLHILQHTLGLNQHGQGTSYRNHFVAGNGHSDMPDVLILVDLGYMAKRDPCAVADCWFSVTDAGQNAVLTESPKPPKISRAKQRYKRYCEYGDCFNSFIEFCRWDADPERSWNTK